MSCPTMRSRSGCRAARTSSSGTNAAWRPSASSASMRSSTAGKTNVPVTVAARRTPGYPNSIAVLGHSGATGEDSDPAQPHVEIRANSWATGTNPRVDSVYQRILAKNPAIRGHNVNLNQGGATVEQLADQANNAIGVNP